MDKLYDGVRFAGLNNVLLGIVPTITNSVNTPIEYCKLYDSVADTFTSYLTEANNATANDVVLVVNNTPGDYDQFYFGSDEKFDSITINVGTAGTVGTIQWGYGIGFGTLGETDNTNSLKNVGTNTVTFTPPSDWIKTSVEGTLAYWIKYRVSASYTIKPIGTQIWLSGKPISGLANATDHNNTNVTDIMSGVVSVGDSIGQWVFDLGTAKNVMVCVKAGVWSNTSTLSVSFDTSADNITWPLGSLRIITQISVTEEIVDSNIAFCSQRYFRLRPVTGGTIGYMRLYEVFAYELGQ